MRYGWVLAWLILRFTHSQLNVQLTKPKLADGEDIYIEGFLQSNYDDHEFNKVLSCKNGGLEVIAFEEGTKGEIQISYSGAAINQVKVEVYPNLSPYPSAFLNPSTITIHPRCSHAVKFDNYYNKITVKLETSSNTYSFHFLLNCANQKTFDHFEPGYLLIAVINCAIMMGVAFYSRIWSIRWKNLPLNFQLKWYRCIILNMIMPALGLCFVLYSQHSSFQTANAILRYVGMLVAYAFLFICFDQIFYLKRSFKKPIIWGRIRPCDILSFLCSTPIFISGMLLENWILYDFLGGCICVGAIKLFRFSSLKQALYNIITSVIIITSTSALFYSLYPSSDHNYASEISSPLFFVVPDLINDLYKKCSWLPVIDIVVPGVLLSYLRSYDENLETGWKGVYTIVGNASFVVATIIWVGLEAVLPIDIPFCSVTYPLLFATISAISIRRNEWKTLWEGRFVIPYDLSTALIHEENPRVSFTRLVDDSILSEARYEDRSSSQSDDQ